MVVFYTIMMTLNAACAFLILMSGVRQQKSYLLSLALLNILGFFFHYYSWALHNASTLTEALFFSQLHTIAIMFSLPVIVFTFGKWSRFHYTSHCALSLFALAVLFILVSYLTGTHLRYVNASELVHYQSVVGYELVLVNGQLSGYFLAYNFIYGLNSILLMFFAARLYNQGKRLLSLSLITFLLLQVLANFASYKLDNLEWALFYLGGVPLTVFSLFCTTLISSFYKAKRQQLIEHHQQQDKLDKAITKLARGLSTLDGNKFYADLAKMIYEFSEADLVLLASLNEDKGSTFTVLKAGVQSKNFSFELSETPAALLLSQDLCLVSNNAYKIFEKDKLLQKEQIQTFLGVPILNQHNQAVGMLSILFKKATNITPPIVNALKIFSSRAAVEIKRRELQRSLKRMAYYDEQSNLPNRVKLLEVIEKEFKQSQESELQALFLLIDLDNFSEVNRQYGYRVGDKVIKILGSRLRDYCDNNYFLARNSGDEFVIIESPLQASVEIQLHKHWQAIKEIINEPFTVGERQVTMQCSMGAVVFPDQVTDHFDVMSFAEHSVLRAKESGRNRYTLFDPAILAQMDRRKEVEEALRSAIAEQQLSLVYQAKVTCAGEVIGAEALLRWLHPVKGHISPIEFIAIAEESGLIHSLGRWVAFEACRQLKLWRDRGEPLFKISINVAASQFDDPNFISYVFHALETHQLSAEYLEIELTETALLSDLERALENIHKLREYGISIAIDDFGTGFSSLSYLQDLPLDVLKIDKSFVDHLGEKRSDVLIKSIIAIANNMGFSTVAEGTENHQQVSALMDMGCDYYQGYYFSRPLPAHEFMSYCLKQSAQQSRSVG